VSLAKLAYPPAKILYPFGIAYRFTATALSLLPKMWVMLSEHRRTKKLPRQFAPDLIPVAIRARRSA